jgi:hypothetical protein
MIILPNPSHFLPEGAGGRENASIPFYGINTLFNPSRRSQNEAREAAF